MIENFEQINKRLLEIKAILKITEEISLKEGVLNFQAELGWDNISKSWIIYIKQKVTDFSLTHELGHIYYAMSWINFDDFAIPPPSNNRADRKFFMLVNNLLDCFVNFSLSHFPELYSSYKESLFNYLDNIDAFCSRIEKNRNLIEVLSWLLLFYIDFNFIIKDEDKVSHKEDIKKLLDTLKENVLPLLDNGKSKLEVIIERLDRFNEVKETKDARKVIQFFVNILIMTDFWERKEIMKQVKMFFPNSINLFKKK